MEKLKKKKIGVIAEYNPFHNGHLYQLKKIREKFGDECEIIVVLSGNYVQRGEFSFIDKWKKTEIALNFGVDIVVELPCYYSIQNAEQFAMGSIKILEYLEVDTIVFGAESNDENEFYNILNLQNSKEYNETLKYYLKKGVNYISATKNTLSQYNMESFLKSNNILGLEYLRAIKNINSSIKPYIIKRIVSDYNEIDIPKDRLQFASASYIRENFMDKNKILGYIPNEVLEIFHEKYDNKYIKNKMFELFKYRFCTDTKSSIIKIYDINTEIYNKINKIIHSCNSYDDFQKNIISKNLSKKRIDRIIMNTLLQIKKEILSKYKYYTSYIYKCENEQNINVFSNIKYKDIKKNEKINYVRILGFSKSGRDTLKKYKTKDIYVNWKDIEKNKDIPKELIEIEKRGFLLADLILERKERLNPIVYLN